MFRQLFALSRLPIRAIIWSALALVYPATLTASVTVQNGLNHDLSVRPGGVYEGTIILQNQSAHEAHVKTYQTDFLFFADGRAEYGKPGTNPRSNSAWIKVWPARATLAPRSSKILYYSMRVPRDPAPVGSYWSMVMVEEVGSQNPSASNEGPEVLVQVNVTTKTRLGLQIASHVENSGAVGLKFNDIRLDKLKRRYQLLLDLENTGERMVRSIVSLELYNAQGAQEHLFQSNRLRTYPGTSVRHNIAMPDVLPGVYRALAVIKPLTGDLFATEFQVQIE